MIPIPTITQITTTAAIIATACMLVAFILSAAASVDRVYARQRPEDEPAGTDWPGCDAKEQEQ